MLIRDASLFSASNMMTVEGTALNEEEIKKSNDDMCFM